MKKQTFLTDYAQHPELAKACLNQSGLTWSEIKERSSDFCDPSSGSVPGFIYYTDTTKFAKKHLLKILEALHTFEDDCGQLDKPSVSEDGETTYLNWLAWFAWENTMSDVMNALQ